MAEVETHEHRLKRLYMRSIRRGIKEMDVILERFAGVHLSTMSETQLTAYDMLLQENDQDLYTWVSGQVTPPPEHIDMISFIKNHLADI